ncbi:dUTP diphosphatase [Heyndrickxia sporothermodurans]|uniref:dUTP diphosphatase n=1 Tax=Heyndrickxia sporothermodurans TaxID=46224 RepID=A0AB37HM28_9BACI|nr:dUTP diphosphatase [Heyndrickxia sporothermodurans]MBL5768001.1 dUTP diphosphatase [Heyndrickxia sporothermodurans]MBL5771594.1 dUTP diphosphatase [Heyndrickxia sporothermodurans]MBL5785880.1 dUTP diphosphatase [Heyndrickxia sporothermodurans]MBL5789386.1 dUTP diphosphatase [Heyndrickxia sporothermodurans]MBL5796638.1 dUTP diphosphatase [Heyndrickxia sporothermodurans]
MNLDKMLTAQAELDKYIVEKKALQGVDLVPNTFLALQVELAEFANEGRWFKHWSDDREPRTSKHVIPCLGNEFSREVNPLLEEFADAVHFFLSIANQKGWQDALYVYMEQLDVEEFDGGLTGIFLEMTYFINKSYFENPSEEKNEKWKEKFGFPQKQYWFRTAWILFLNIGINGFGFTLDQIEEAYWGKHEVNYQRQDSGVY